MLHEKIIEFYTSLSLQTVKLPRGITVMNPYKGENADAIIDIITQFYQKFYNDNNPRRMILGINPGRKGAGVTGLMFTDTIRLNQVCDIELKEFHSRELSSEFFYRVIEKYGGVERFYSDFYVGAISPLGFSIKNEREKEVNFNYYDSKELQQALIPFIKIKLHQQMNFNIKNDVCYCLGTGKNYNFLQKLNGELGLFKNIVPLDHPRYILQYKRKQADSYIDAYMKSITL